MQANIFISNLFSIFPLNMRVVANTASEIASEPIVSHLQIEVQPLRRRSEGDAQQDPNHSPITRRTSLDSLESKSNSNSNSNTTSNTLIPSTSEILKCRNPKCEASARLHEAKRFFKSCHNCAFMYCSRECRRAHWEKHRKACIHSRVSVLCRQVLATCKDDPDTLRHLTIVARHGYASQGRGVVRILFRSPENAEMFVHQGYQRLGEVTFVRWPDLMPQEMGLDLYSELLRLSTEYRPDSKMLLYVAICVMSEKPRTSAHAVKWERQLVSRCAKLKLCKSVPIDASAVPLHAQICTGRANSNNSGSPSNSKNRTLMSLNDVIGHAKVTKQPAAAVSSSSSSSQPSAPTQSAPTPSPSPQAVSSYHSGHVRAHSDILILTFNMASRLMQSLRYREHVVQTIQAQLRKRGVSLRLHYPEVFQRLTSFVEGTTDRLMPVTINPKDTTTGRAFTCIVMPHMGDVNRIKMPNTEGEQTIETIDCLEGAPPE